MPYWARSSPFLLKFDDVEPDKPVADGSADGHRPERDLSSDDAATRR